MATDPENFFVAVIVDINEYDLGRAEYFSPAQCYTKMLDTRGRDIRPGNVQKWKRKWETGLLWVPSYPASGILIAEGTDLYNQGFRVIPFDGLHRILAAILACLEAAEERSLRPTDTDSIWPHETFTVRIHLYRADTPHQVHLCCVFIKL